MEFEFDPEKDERLRSTRGIGFLDAIEAIETGRILLDFEHPNQSRYPGQRMLVLDIDGYAHCVPYLDDGQVLILKTVYPNRRFRHLIEGERDE